MPLSLKEMFWLHDDHRLHQSLRTQHAVCAFVHMCNVIGTIIATYGVNKQNLFSVPVVMHFTKTNSRTTTGAHEVFADFNLSALCIMFGTCAFVDHIACSTFAYDRYMQLVDQRNNYFRWIEYSVSSSLMILVIATLSGILDFSTLVCLFALMALTIVFGYIIDQNANDRAQAKSLFALSMLPYGILWALIYTHFGVNMTNGSGPWFVWLIEIGLFLLFGVFAYIHKKQIDRQGKWASYAYSETMFNIASLLAKTFLNWILVGGVLSMAN